MSNTNVKKLYSDKKGVNYAKGKISKAKREGRQS